MSSLLLPRHATTKLEAAIADAIDRDSTISTGVEAGRTAKLIDRPATFLPWLVIEYGLGEIARFFDDQEVLIDTGIPWQRIKGTPAAITEALSWIDYDDTTIFDEVVRRRMWNRFQIEMGRLPDLSREVAELLDAEYLGNVSSPARSYFFRGFEVYDVRPLEWGYKRWGNAIWGDSSGVPVPGGKTKWSHGREHSIDAPLSSATMEALNLNHADEDDVYWDDLPWDAPGRTWDGVTDAAALREWILSKTPTHLGFYDGAGGLIGARRSVPGSASVGALSTLLARTGFGDGAGSQVETVRVLFHRSGPADAPTRLWLAPGEIGVQSEEDPDVLRSEPVPFSFLLGRTVREIIDVRLVVE